MIAPRWAIRYLFALIAFMMGLWTFRIGEFQSALGLTHQDLAFVLITMPIGASLTMTQVPRIGRRLGILGLIRVGFLLAFTTLLLLSFFPSPLLSSLVLFVFGASAAFFEVGINAVASKIDREDRPILSSCHGFWSIGFGTGALVSSYLASLNVSFTTQQLILTPIAVLLLFALLPILPAPRATSKEAKGFVWPELAILPICFLPIAGLYIEGAISDWNTPYLFGELGWGEVTTGFVAFAFMSAMAASRFSGDGLRARFAVVLLFQISTFLSLVGMALYAWGGNFALIAIGAILAGLGAGNVYPFAIILASANRDDSEAAHRIGAIALVSFNAFLIAPILMGFLGERYSLSMAFGSTVILFAVTFLWIRLATKDL